MNDDDMTYWVVEQFVQLGNESFWHEKARLLQRKGKYPESDESMREKAMMVGKRDVLNYSGRLRIRVEREETVFDSGATA
ncbi:hypothetical protein KGG70_gp24 [Streptomyces phage Celia]|uniref:Uncharacterized protein n=1 Tax=Streptomyces phage Celia TaxID=2590946 RepID=A0A516KRE5_9CAUD|nr:hypothetical protein KGG70_gp24 [Streptomyces phage Celia]QDP44260.1 hypothetical protein SEA_CELIA_57 [Streptomyces phage Celia]